KLGIHGLPDPLKEQELKQLWSDLEKEDAAAGYRAICLLTLRPKEAIPFLKANLKAEPFKEMVRFKQLLVDLDDAKFTVRDKAMQELKTIGGKIAPLLRKALSENPSAQVKVQVEKLLPTLPPSPRTLADLRHLRAVQVLEQIGSPEAMQLMDALA